MSWNWAGISCDAFLILFACAALVRTHLIESKPANPEVADEEIY